MKKTKIEKRIRTIPYTCPYINNIQDYLNECIEMLNTLSSNESLDKDSKKIIKKVKSTLSNKCIGKVQFRKNQKMVYTGLEQIRMFNSSLREEKTSAEYAIKRIHAEMKEYISYQPYQPYAKKINLD